MIPDRQLPQHYPQEQQYLRLPIIDKMCAEEFQALASLLLEQIEERFVEEFCVYLADSKGWIGAIRT
jgi:hypothetical protein